MAVFRLFGLFWLFWPRSFIFHEEDVECRKQVHVHELTGSYHGSELRYRNPVRFDELYVVPRGGFMSEVLANHHELLGIGAPVVRIVETDLLAELTDYARFFTQLSVRCRQYVLTLLYPPTRQLPHDLIRRIAVLLLEQRLLLVRSRRLLTRRPGGRPLGGVRVIVDIYPPRIPQRPQPPGGLAALIAHYAAIFKNGVAASERAQAICERGDAHGPGEFDVCA